MSRLHIFTVHINPSRAQPYEEAQFVEEGFSWKAFLFTLLWTLYHRLWLATLGLALLDGLIYHLLKTTLLTQPGYGLLHLGVHLLAGLYANDWRRAKLQRKGYIIADVVSGDSLIRAEQRFFDRYFASPAAFAAA